MSPYIKGNVWQGYSLNFVSSFKDFCLTLSVRNIIEMVVVAHLDFNVVGYGKGF